MSWYAALLVIHIVCLAVLAAKHRELVNKFQDVPAGSCILFVDYNGDINNPNVKWVNNINVISSSMAREH